MTTFQDFLAEEMARDPEFRSVWEADRLNRELLVALNTARRASGLTQAELAKRVGTSQPTIARWERGDTFPRLDALARIAAATGVGFTIAPDGALTAQIASPRPATSEKSSESSKKYPVRGRPRKVEIAREPKARLAR